MSVQWAPPSTSAITYDEAVLYCKFCNHGGYIDWRLPVYYEWQLIGKQVTNIHHYPWFAGYDAYYSSDSVYFAVPVRDI